MNNSNLQTPQQIVNIKNATVVISTLPDIFPSGEYKGVGEAMVNGEFLVQVTGFVSIISSNRDTFGWNVDLTIYKIHKNPWKYKFCSCCATSNGKI